MYIVDYWSETSSETNNENSGYRRRDGEGPSGPVRTDDPVADGELFYQSFPPYALTNDASTISKMDFPGLATGTLKIQFAGSTPSRILLPVFKPQVVGYNGYDGWVTPTDTVYITFTKLSGQLLTLSSPNVNISSRFEFIESVNSNTDRFRLYVNNLSWTDISDDYYEIELDITSPGLPQQDMVIESFNTYGPPTLTSVFAEAADVFTPNDPNNSLTYPVANNSISLAWTSFARPIDVRYIGDATMQSTLPINLFGGGSMHVLEDMEPFSPITTRDDIVFGPIEVNWPSGSGSGFVYQRSWQYSAVSNVYIGGSNGNAGLNRVHYWTV